MDPKGNAELSPGLSHRVVASELYPNVRYRLSHQLGAGGMALAFYALRESPQGLAPAVLKIARPEIVSTAGPTAALMVRKEAIALGRLNERVPPTPFVVRFLDTGVIRVGEYRPVDLPWIALEYVHGGPEGATLEERVEYSLNRTGYAFDAQRAAHLVECLTHGLSAIHDVGVVHRDLTPGNVLCCGFGTSEVFKIADFGIARPSGVTATFGNVLLGTPGYGAPEQVFSGEAEIGPYSDVFSLACVLYYALTGEKYFATDNLTHAFVLVREGARRSVLDARALSPEMRDNPAACRSLDLALARATSLNPAERPPNAEHFGATVLPWFRQVSPGSLRASDRLVASVAAQALPRRDGFRWTVRHPPGDDRLLRSVAWDGDGQCLAVTTQGLEFWNGTTWERSSQSGLDHPEALRIAGLVRPGRWFVGGQGGLLALYGSEGVISTLKGPEDVSLSYASGDPDDLAVAAGEAKGSPPVLFTIASRRFFRPVPIEPAALVTSLARLDDARWLLTGRTIQGSGFVAVYFPLSLDISFLLTPPTGALIACASQVDRGIGMAVGRKGVTVRFDGTRTTSAVIPGEPDLASCGIDIAGRCWAGGAGALWTTESPTDTRWICAWQDAAWKLPLVSLRAEVGVVTAVTVDGAVIEGRADT